MHDMLWAESCAPPWQTAPETAPVAKPGSLDSVVDLATKLVASRRSSLLLPESDGVLHVAAASGIAEPRVERVRVHVGDAVAGMVALSRRPVFSNDRQVRPDHRSRGYMTGAFISVPVPLDERSCGVLNVADPRRPEGFRSDDLQALEALALQVARALRFDHMSQHAAALEQKVRQLRRQVIEVQEAERQRIARDLHDEAQHALTAAILRLDLDAMQFTGDVAAAASLRHAREQLVECVNTLHTIAFNLRPRILEDLGLHAALRSMASHAMELTDIDVSVMVSGQAWALDEIEELAILRVVQEALTNVRKHAHASHVRVALRYEAAGLTLKIADDGTGLRTHSPAAHATGERVSLGISGMRERVELLGGRFTIGRGRGGGTRITARLPRDSA